MRIENWLGHEIRFVEKDGEWWAVLKDICDALGLKTGKTAERLDPETMDRFPLEIDIKLPSVYNREKDYIPSGDVDFTDAKRKQWMIVVNEEGIYETLFASRKLEAKKFKIWTTKVMKKLRHAVGLKGYQVMQMTDPDIQMQIDNILDSLYWDDEKKMSHAICDGSGWRRRADSVYEMKGESIMTNSLFGLGPAGDLMTIDLKRDITAELNMLRGMDYERRRQKTDDLVKYAMNDVKQTQRLYQFIQKSIVKVIFNDPATIVFWGDGTKTVVKATNEPFDPEKGLAMAIAKYHFGNEGNYYNIFKCWLSKGETL